MMRGPTINRRITRFAFIVIIVFVAVQVVWWLVFQQSYINHITQTTLENWQRDADVLNSLQGVSVDDMPGLLERYPHLSFNPERAHVMVNPEAVQSFTREQNGFVRMFAFEGPFFVLVVLTGLYIIGRSLRTERDLKIRQQNFLSAITHEFKTPMSTLRLLIETALMRKLAPEKQRDYLKRMAAELNRLEQTSEQVLASARLEQSREAPVLEPLDLNSVVQGTIGKLRAGLEARGAKLTIVYSPDALPVSLDPSAFSVVLSNLLDNAVKYSPGSEKPITVRLEQQDDLVLLHVEDKGVGISDKEKLYIFERFYRVGSEMTRRSKGVGLGLYLVKSITEAMNGWVKVASSVPEGTRFTVVLPRRVSLTPNEQMHTTGEPAGSLTL